MPALRGFVLLLLLALAGCAAAPDPQETRLCRMIAPTLLPEGAQAVVLRQSGAVEPFAQEGGRRRVRIDWRPATAPTHRPLFILCRFGEKPTPSAPPDLLGVETESGPFPEPRVIFLKRFWLETPEAQLADPGFAAREPARLGFAAAYAAQHALSALPSMAVYALLATAYALIYGLVGRIVLSFGELAAAAGYAAWFVFAFAADAAPAALLAGALLIGLWSATLHGVALSRFVFEPLRRASGQQVLVAAVGLSLAFQEYLRLAQGSSLRWAGPILAEPVTLARAEGFAVTVTPVALLVALLALAAGLALLAAMRVSRFGRDWRAAADDAETAALFGVSPRAIFAKTFALSAALAGLAGVALTAHLGGVGYAAATTLGLKALIGAILGGVGSVPGAFLGGLTIGLVEALWSAAFPIVWRDVAVYGLLALVLAIRPEGLFGWRDERPRQR